MPNHTRKHKGGDRLGQLGIYLVSRCNDYHYGRFLCPECDHVFVTRISLIAQNHSKRCPSCSKKHKRKQLSSFRQKHRRDISGQRFGKLIAICPTDERAMDGSVIWKCKCDCGTICYKSKNNLGKTTWTCGHCNISTGEDKIKNILSSENINFEQEKKFKKCINPNTNRHLRFDFYLPDYNCCIEYDGKQHFYYNGYGWNTKENFENIQRRDSIKDKFCEDNGIGLIRFSYLEFENLTPEYVLQKLTSIRVIKLDKGQ